MERLVVLPFSISCTSQSSVAVKETRPRKPKQKQNPSARGEETGQYFSGARMKSPLPSPKSTISAGLQRLIKSFKSLPHLFVYKEKFVMDMKMEIGFPTDVKRVTHIGWDGSVTTMKSWAELKPPEVLSLPPISLHHFELAMLAQAYAPVAYDKPSLVNMCVHN